MGRVVLCILDGWGHREGGADNAIFHANTPTWDRLWNNSPKCLLEASAHAVGLPDGQMGNSEVGHMTIGSGRTILQDLPRINKAISEKTLADQHDMTHFVSKLKESGGICHLMGLFSPGGVHSHQDHILALADTMIAHNIPVIFHPILDGRDTPPQSAEKYLMSLIDYCSQNATATIGTVAGRFYTMDRDNRWERVEKSYKTLVVPEHSPSAPITPIQILEESYSKGIYDEFVLPTALKNYPGMKDGDGFVMANFRADRAREISRALLDPNFQEFTRLKTVHFAASLAMTEYSDDLKPHMKTLFPSETPAMTLAEVLSQHHLKQLHVAETEKYAHVTFFFNGGREDPFPGEDRILVPSPKVETYDQQPEMSATDVTDAVVKGIEQDRYPFIVVNYANPDMVGHTGNLTATIRAIETVDQCLCRIVEALQEDDVLIISADHGNAEMMEDENSGSPYTAHTLNKVPLVLSPLPKGKTLKNTGTLADIAPTILDVMGIPIPSQMTGTSLLQRSI